MWERSGDKHMTYLLLIPVVLIICCALDRKTHAHLPGEIALHSAIHPVGDEEEGLDEHEEACEPAHDDVDGPAVDGESVEDALDVHCFAAWEWLRELEDEAVADGGDGEPGAREPEEDEGCPCCDDGGWG